MAAEESPIGKVSKPAASGASWLDRVNQVERTFKKWLNWKVLSWSLVAMVIIALGVTSGLLNHRRIVLQKNLEAAIQEKILLQGSLVKVTHEKETVEQDLAKTEVALDSEKIHAKALQFQVSEAERQREEILARMSQQDELIGELQEKIQLLAQAAKGDRASLEAKGKSGAEGAIQQGVVELEKVIVSKRPRLQGEIIGIDQEHPWVVVNLGQVNNLQEGIILSVLRKGELIGKVQVEQVLKDMANARILTIKEGEEFQVADAVKEF